MEILPHTYIYHYFTNNCQTNMNGIELQSKNQCKLTVLPALSSPRIKTQYSSFCIKYLYNPYSNVYILLHEII